jgi:hypothetical protein
MGHADAFAALTAIVLVEGDDAMPVLKPDAPVALRRDAVRLTRSSKKMRLTASIPRLGISSNYASPTTCAVSLHHRPSQRPPMPAAEVNLTLGP